MKTKWLLIAGIALLVVAALLIVNTASKQQQVTAIQNVNSPVTQTSEVPHDHPGTTANAIPAHFEVPPSKTSLAPTLNPESFTGITREAYSAVREIPVTIAQLPCYCHCDRGFGHKSLYSCFEDDHAAHCAVCVQEALLALKLEKEQKMSPAQIRDTIVAQYAH